MNKLLEGLADFIFPSRCPACGGLVRGRGGWCTGCLTEWARARRLATAWGGTGEAWALGSYHGPIRRLVTRLKYDGDMSRLPYIDAFIEAASSRLPIDGWRPDFAVAVPLFPMKENKRGFNQAELIFRGWCDARGIQLRRVLTRTRETRPQYGLTRAERSKNVAGAFALDAGADVAGAGVMVMDDIFTTGATLFSCARVLRDAGAARVFGLALASDRAN